MARTLPKALMDYQIEDERRVMQIAAECGETELVRSWYNKLKVTADDLSREYTDDDMRQLCLRTKCRVDMTALNCVYDAKKKLQKKGRLDNRSERFVNAMLTKAVMRKKVKPYTDKEIATSKEINRSQLKKDNNCRLDRWRVQNDIAKSQDQLVGLGLVSLNELPDLTVPDPPSNTNATTATKKVSSADLSRSDLFPHPPPDTHATTATRKEVSVLDLNPSDLFPQTPAETNVTKTTKAVAFLDLNPPDLFPQSQGDTNAATATKAASFVDLNHSDSAPNTQVSEVSEAHLEIPLGAEDWAEFALHQINSESMTIDLQTESEPLSEPLFL